MGSLWRRYRGDVIGGVNVAIVALPLALAFGIASGAGAAAGLYAAIFAGFITSLFGGSSVQVSGPTGAMTVVLVTVVSRHGINTMLLAGFLAGLMQLALGLSRAGGFVRYLPQSVIAGFTNGIAVLIFLSQWNYAMGAPIITVATILGIVVALRFAKGIPASLFGLAIGILVNEFFVNTAEMVSSVPTTLPTLALPIWSPEVFASAIGPAITICLLGSIKSLLSATVGDAMTGQKHNGNRELVAQGLGNMVASMVGGVPVTGALSRTALNAKSGARTRLAGLLHASILLLVVLAFGGWAERIPLAVLAGILMVTSVQMMEWGSFVLIPRAPWAYTLKLLVTLALIIYADLIIAVASGFLLAVIFFFIEMSRSQFRQSRTARRWQSDPPVSTHPDVTVFTLNGPLFFGMATRLAERLRSMPNARVLVLDLSNVPVVDASGGLMLERLAKELRKRGQSLFIVGLAREPFRVLARLGLFNYLDRYYVCAGMRQALRRAAAEANRLNEDESGEASQPSVALQPATIS